MPSIFEHRTQSNLKKNRQRASAANPYTDTLTACGSAAGCAKKWLSAAILLLLFAWLWLGYDPIDSVHVPTQQLLTLPTPGQVTPTTTLTSKHLTIETPRTTETIPTRTTSPSSEDINQQAINLIREGKVSEATTLLENTLKANPNTGLLFENLRHLYAALASQSYQLAIEPDKIKPINVTLASQQGPQQLQFMPPETLLAKANAAATHHSDTNLPTPSTDTIQVPSTTETKTDTTDVPSKPNTATDTAPTAANAPSTIAANNHPEDTASTSPIREADVTPAIANVSTTTKSSRETTPIQKPANDPNAAQKAIQAALKRWSNAWSKQDARSYIASYAPNYTPTNSTRKQWITQRTTRIETPKQIHIELSNIRIKFSTPNKAQVSFMQHYHSNLLDANNHKILEFELIGQTWLITSESGR